MQPVDCVHCGTTVTVSKSSQAQTSIQWLGATTSCPERPGLALGQTCPALADSIREAVRSGAVSVAGTVEHEL